MAKFYPVKTDPFEISLCMHYCMYVLFFSFQGFAVDIYALEEDSDCTEDETVTHTASGNPSSAHSHDTATPLVHVGRTSILPQQYLVPDKTEGKIVLTMFSSDLLSIGTVTCKFSVKSTCTCTCMCIHVTQRPRVHCTCTCTCSSGPTVHTLS